ncbi:MAG: UDP-N-acetylmuramoyl-L-alanine--D-glutamate ligase [bacterium]
MAAETVDTETMHQDERVLVVGLGVTGLSCVKYLVERGYQVAVADSRQSPPGLDELRSEYPDVGVFLGEFEESVFRNARQLVISPGVPLASPAVQAAIEAGARVIGDVDLFARAVNAPVIAITGSNAKSTVTTLVGEMAAQANLNVAVGGNLGEPMLDLLGGDMDLYVLELSSFQLETAHELKPAVATVLNISADHMDRYDDLDSYAAAKARILNGAEAAVYNLDDERVMAMPRLGASTYFTVESSDDDNVFNLQVIEGRTWLCRGRETVLDTDQMLIAGRHNHANALAALAIGSLLEIPMDAMLNALQQFRGLRHRSEFVASCCGVSWYNDSKGTNPGATIAALQGLHKDDDSRTVLIAGGDCKQADFSVLGSVMQQCVRALILIGRDREEIRQVAPEGIPVFEAGDMEDAVKLSMAAVQPGDRVLLSPACASFDMYRGFEERGDHFCGLVRGQQE